MENALAFSISKGLAGIGCGKANGPSPPAPLEDAARPNGEGSRRRECAGCLDKGGEATAKGKGIDRQGCLSSKRHKAGGNGKGGKATAEGGRQRPGQRPARHPASTRDALQTATAEGDGGRQRQTADGIEVDGNSETRRRQLSL